MNNILENILQYKNIILTIIIIIIITYKIYFPRITKNIKKTVKNITTNIIPKSKSDKLMPILDPKYNMREICKNMLLLEDHLFQRKKRCKQCIKKHFLLIEAFAEEMITLDNKKEHKQYYDLPDKIRDIERNFLNNADMEDIAQQLRVIRKDLTKDCFGNF